MIVDGTSEQRQRSQAFEAFVRAEGQRIRRALVASFGVEVGNEATDEALSVAWERWDALAGMQNTAGYVYRIGQSKARPHIRWRSRRQLFPDGEPLASTSDAAAALDLLHALEQLSPEQRAAVMLVKCFGYTHHEVADVLGVTVGAVNNLTHRGLLRLRSLMKEEPS